MKKPKFLLVFLTAFALVAGTTVAPVGATNDSRAERFAAAREYRAARNATPRVPGSVYSLSNQSYQDTVDSLIETIQANPALSLISTINHAAAAESVGLDLDPNIVIFFGNPNLGTPIMQADQVAGLDLPQKLHVIEEDGRVYVGYNNPELLAARHGVSGVDSLATISGALAAISDSGTGADGFQRAINSRRFVRQDGLTTVASNVGMDETWDQLLAAIDASPANVALTLDHQANAARVGLELNPTRLVVFGNPNIGTPLMQADASAGIDLPLKMLVWEDDNGDVFVTTNETRYLERRHGLDGVNPDGIDGALNNFLNAATAAAS